VSTQRLWVVVARDLRIARRRPSEALMPVIFFVVACSLFPLGVGPEAVTLRQIAPGVVWVCALLSAMLSLSAMYAADHADGSLEQMMLAEPFPLSLVVAKALAHWMLTALPLLVAAPLFGLLFGMQPDAIGVLMLTMALGTPVLSLLGGVGAALTLGLRNGAVLVLLLVLPLCIPVLIFGAGAVSALDAGLTPAGHLYLLAAQLPLGNDPFAFLE
jgi:heme exporter protein B